MAFFLEDVLDVINGKVLLAGPDNLLPQGIGFGSFLRSFSRGQEKGPGGILPELMNQDAKAAFRITKAAGGLLGGELLDKESPEGFVLAVGGIGGLKEGLGGIS